MRRGGVDKAIAAPIPLYRPTIRRRQMHAVLECLVSEEIGPGALARKLVREVASALRLAGGVALTDYGAALTAALHAVTAVAGSRRVLLPALAPLAYVQAAERLGLTPLLVDVDPDSGILSRDALQRLMAHEPQAAVMYHAAGQPGVPGCAPGTGSAGGGGYHRRGAGTRRRSGRHHRGRRGRGGRGGRRPAGQPCRRDRPAR